MKQQQYLFLFQFLCWLISVLPTGFSWQSLVYLDLGSNFLEGPLPSSICNSMNLQILVLANNKLNGTIPECLGNFSSGLTSLDLRHNSFNGTIPSYFSKDLQLKNLGLNGNRLEGKLPRSLKHSKYLEVLDVGNNNISDTFPIWLQSLPQLHVLILRSNSFYGTIGTPKSPFEKLRIVDLANNSFTGSVPAEFLENLPAMNTANDSKNELKYMGEGQGDGSYYLDSVSLVMKGLDMEIKRVLSILTTIDLSGNKFEGEIPKSIRNLHALKLLNLSHNSFRGRIPAELGNLNSLESLDLSWNQFTGQIPWQLTNLTFLQTFNVSKNHLVGRIPQGSQFNTFNNDSYYGNPELCGTPLDDCGRKPPSPSEMPKFQERDCLDLLKGFTWKSVVLGYGFGMTIGLFLGGLMFFTTKPKWLLRIIEEIFKQVGMKTNKRKYIILAI